jgi:hypothetical protein
MLQGNYVSVAKNSGGNVANDFPRSDPSES